MLVAVYDRVEEGDPLDWREEADPSAFRVAVAVRTRGLAVVPRKHHHRPFAFPGHLVPRRHAPILEGSAAWRVLRSGRPVHVERVTGYDMWGFQDLAVTAKPVRWHGKLAKVVLVAVPHRDRSVLVPQLVQGPVGRVARAYQVI